MHNSASARDHLRAVADQFLQRLQLGKYCVVLRQHCNQYLRGNIPYQFVLRKWTAAKPADGRIESPATRIKRRANARCRFVPPRMKMYAKFSLAIRSKHRCHRLSNQIG